MNSMALPRVTQAIATDCLQKENLLGLSIADVDQHWQEYSRDSD